MAGADYIQCDECGRKCIYEGEDDLRQGDGILVFCNIACAREYVARGSGGRRRFDGGSGYEFRDVGPEHSERRNEKASERHD